MTTITGTFTDSASNTMRGKVTFTPKTVVSNAGHIVVTDPIPAHLDRDGVISVDLTPGEYGVKIEVYREHSFIHDYWLLGGLEDEPYVFSAPQTVPIYNQVTVPDGGSVDLSSLLQL